MSIYDFNSAIQAPVRALLPACDYEDRHRRHSVSTHAVTQGRNRRYQNRVQTGRVNIWVFTAEDPEAPYSGRNYRTLTIHFPFAWLRDPEAFVVRAKPLIEAFLTVGDNETIHLDLYKRGVGYYTEYTEFPDKAELSESYVL